MPSHDYNWQHSPYATPTKAERIEQEYQDHCAQELADAKQCARGVIEQCIERVRVQAMGHETEFADALSYLEYAKEAL